MIADLNAFFELSKVLGFSVCVLIVGAVITMNYLHKWIGVRYCDYCQKELDKRSS